MAAVLLRKCAVLPLATVAVLTAVAVSLSAPVPGTRSDPGKLPDSEAAQPAVDPAKLATSAAFLKAAERNHAVSRNNLKLLALAVHSYHDEKAHFPADVRDKDGKPLLSWRVLLLPHLDQQALYARFKLDEPWDSKNNIRLLEQIPKVFQSPRVTLKRKGYTVYQGFSGPDAVFRPGKPGLSLAAIVDGTSNTVLAVEATAAVPWSKPADIPFDMEKALPDFGKAYGQQPLGALCDGSVRVLDLKVISTQTLKWAINPADGMVLGPDW